MTSVPEEISEYMAKIGAKGGKAKGKNKKRSAEHYQRLGEIIAKARGPRTK